MPSLFNSGRDTSFALYVGALPSRDQPHLFVPPGARVLGAAEVSGYATGILDVPGTPDSVSAEMERGLAALDWTPAPGARVGTGSRYGGFRSAAESRASGMALCRNHQFMLVAVASNTDATSRVTLEMFPASMALDACSAQAAESPPGSRVGISVPTVLNPPGTIDNPSCPRPFSSQSTAAAVRSLVSPAAMLDFYSRQLADSGWTAVTPGPASIGRAWTRVDSSGARVETVITVATNPSDTTCRDLSMQLRRYP